MKYKNILLNKIKTPSVIIKISLISLIFLSAISVEMGVIRGYSISETGKNQINILLFVMHIFTYFEIYAKYLVIGLILLIPDIISEPYMAYQIYQNNKNRNELFKNTIVLILIYILVYILWFILLTFIISIFWLNAFDFTWPQSLLAHEYATTQPGTIGLIHIPISAIKIPLPICFLLIVARIFIGFLIIALASFYVTFKKNNISYGIGLAVILYAISDILYETGSTTWDLFDDPNKAFSLAHFTFKYTLCSFFTFENYDVNFTSRIIHNYVFGLIVVIILGTLIWKDMRKKDLC